MNIKQLGACVAVKGLLQMITFVTVARPEDGFSHTLTWPTALQSQSEAAFNTQFHFCNLWMLYMSRQQSQLCTWADRQGGLHAC